MILAKRVFIFLLLGAWVPFLVFVVGIYAVTRLPEANRFLPIDGRLFGEFLNVQVIFTVFLSIFGGAGLIANDLRTGAILVYLSRPLTRRDYVLGKLGVLLALNLSVTLQIFVCHMARLSIARKLERENFRLSTMRAAARPDARQQCGDPSSPTRAPPAFHSRSPL